MQVTTLWTNLIILHAFPLMEYSLNVIRNCIFHKLYRNILKNNSNKLERWYFNIFIFYFWSFYKRFMDFQGSFCQQKMSHLFAFVPTFTNYSNTMNIQVETLIQRKGIKIRISCTLLSLERTAINWSPLLPFHLLVIKVSSKEDLLTRYIVNSTKMFYLLRYYKGKDSWNI